MPLLDAKSEHVYIKSDKLFISSDDRESGTNFDYTFLTNSNIQNVIALELTGYNFPSQIAPTFIAATANAPGNNIIDFQIYRSPFPRDLISVSMPEKKYTYENLLNTTESYISALQRVIQAAFDADATWGGLLTVTVYRNTDNKTEINVYSTSSLVDEIKIIFNTGVNSANAAYSVMGFENADYTFTALPDGFNHYLISPNSTDLDPFKFVDIFIDDCEFSPFARVYLQDDYYGTTSNELNVTRTRLFSSKPIRNFRRIGIKIRLLNNTVPPDVSKPNDLVLNVLSLNNEIHEIPEWVKQSFSL